MLNKLLICFFTLFMFKQNVNAFSFSIFPLASENRYIETQAKEFKFASVTNYALSASHLAHQLLLEHTELSNRSGNQTLSFLEVNQEYHINYLHQVTKWMNFWSLYMGAGTGVYKTSVRTQYLNTETEDNSGNTLFLSGIVSMQLQYQYFHGQLDFKLIEAKDYSPQPQPSLILRIGLRF